MLDAMLIAHRCQDLVRAQFCRVPDGPLSPTIWVDEAGALCAWHPLLTEPLRSESSSANWDAESFAQNAGVIEGGVGDYLHRLLEASGAPLGYYANYPGVVSDMRRGQAAFTQAATAQDDAEVEKEATGTGAPSLDSLLRVQG